MRKFPTCSDPKEVACFHCGGTEGAVQDAGYPPGHGQFRKTCKACGRHTYFDLKGK